MQVVAAAGGQLGMRERKAFLKDRELTACWWESTEYLMMFSRASCWSGCCCIGDGVGSSVGGREVSFQQEHGYFTVR